MLKSGYVGKEEGKQYTGIQCCQVFLALLLKTMIQLQPMLEPHMWRSILNIILKKTLTVVILLFYIKN